MGSGTIPTRLWNRIIDALGTIEFTIQHSPLAGRWLHKGYFMQGHRCALRFAPSLDMKLPPMCLGASHGGECLTMSISSFVTFHLENEITQVVHRHNITSVPVDLRNYPKDLGSLDATCHLQKPERVHSMKNRVSHPVAEKPIVICHSVT